MADGAVVVALRQDDLDGEGGRSGSRTVGWVGGGAGDEGEKKDEGASDEVPLVVSARVSSGAGCARDVQRRTAGFWILLDHSYLHTRTRAAGHAIRTPLGSSAGTGALSALVLVVDARLRGSRVLASTLDDQRPRPPPTGLRLDLDLAPWPDCCASPRPLGGQHAPLLPPAKEQDEEEHTLRISARQAHGVAPVARQRTASANNDIRLPSLQQSKLCSTAASCSLSCTAGSAVDAVSVAGIPGGTCCSRSASSPRLPPFARRLALSRPWQAPPWHQRLQLIGPGRPADGHDEEPTGQCCARLAQHPRATR